MIGQLTGTVLRRDPPQLVLDVGGLGFELEAPLSTFERLPEPGVRTTLHTHLVVREDALLLYGFATDAERVMFRQLLRVAGIGPRIALAVLSSMDVDTLVALVQSEDLARLVRIPGIGRKTAERLVLELREPLAKFAVKTLPGSDAAARRDAESALLALGYRAPEVQSALKDLSATDGSSEMLVRAALKRLLKG